MRLTAELADFAESEIAALDAVISKDDAPVAIAFSGGGDSVALLHLAATWSTASGRRLKALIVDHGLRAKSAETAAEAASIAAVLRVDTDILAWCGDKPETALQERARAARHRLLAQACDALGARVLLLGHTADDQAETVAMRVQRGGGLRAFAGMRAVAPSPVWPQGRELTLVRPLLGFGRGELRARLKTAGAAWLDDPANADSRYERVRTRRRLAAFPDVRRRLGETARSARRLDDVVLAAAADIVSRQARFGPGGDASVSRGALRGTGPAVRARIVEALLQAASGRAEPVDAAGLTRLSGELADAGAFRAATLAGARVLADGEVLVFARDPGAVAGRAGVAPALAVSLAAGESTIWDGRFLVGPAPEAGAIIARGAHEGRIPDPVKTALSAVHASARPGVPLFLTASGETIFIPVRFIGGRIVARALLPERPDAWSRRAFAASALGAGPAKPHIGVD